MMKALGYGARLLKETAVTWEADGAPRMGAAAAFYATLSSIPLAMLILRVMGSLFSEDAARAWLFGRLENVVDSSTAATMEELILTSLQSAPTVGTTALGLLILSVAASGLFNQIRGALNTIWGFSRPRGLFRSLLVGRALSIAFSFGIGLLLIMLFALSGVLSAAVEMTGSLLPIRESILVRLVEALVTFLVVFLVVGAMYRVLPHGNLPWGVVGVGAAVTSALFLIGKTVLGLYLSMASIGSVYGAASSLLVILIWFLYIAQVFYVGVAFTKVYARHRRERKEAAAGGEAGLNESAAR